jgi:hypothetical protein
MKTVYASVACVAAVMLSACGEGGETLNGGGGPIPDVPVVLQSEILSPDPGGGYASFGFDESRINDSRTFRGVSNAWGYKNGTNEFVGLAGVDFSVSMGDVITGNVMYDTSYNLELVDPVTGGTNVTGDMEILADFSDGTVTGNAAGLVVDGTFTGQSLGGSVTYGGVTADLGGQIGQLGVTGAFAGNTDDALLVGGFASE